MGGGLTIFGLDISVTSTGMVVISSRGEVLFNETVGESLIKPTTLDDQKRVNNIVNKIEEVIGGEFGVKYVVIEGFAFNQWGQSASAHKIIELTGAIKHMLFQYNYDPVIIPASKARKIVLGGNVTTTKAEKKAGLDTKKKIAMALKDKCDRSFPSDDENDAYIMAEALRKTIQLSGAETVTQAVRDELNPPKKRKKRKKKKAVKK